MIKHALLPVAIGVTVGAALSVGLFLVWVLYGDNDHLVGF